MLFNSGATYDLVPMGVASVLLLVLAFLEKIIGYYDLYPIADG